MSHKLVSPAVLRTLVPPSALNAENFQELATKAVIEELAAGKTIFKAGDNDRKMVYLLEGEIEVTADDAAPISIKGDSDLAKHALANNQPRKLTATTKTAVSIVRFDSDLLDILLTWDQLSGIEVSDIAVEEDEEGGGDWMTRILQSKAFMQVPPANIQAMFMRIQEMPVKSGDVIINQDDDGDYYYIIRNGTCKVTRKSKTGSEIPLAELTDGAAFGEEALLSEAKRNASITMTTDGMLMRLSKQDFNELLKEPMLTWVNYAEGKAIVDEGGVWLDVRLESEFANNGIEGAMNVPLFMLRMKVDSLDSARQYITYCDTGRRSSAAAFLLSERGLQVCVLKDGISAIPQ